MENQLLQNIIGTTQLPVPTMDANLVGSGDIESSSSTITTLINESKNISVTFSETVPPSITSSLKSKMFTKGIQDTISIGLNIPKGFHSVNVSSELGNISVFSSPDQGSINGELVLEYTNQSVENVLRDDNIKL